MTSNIILFGYTASFYFRFKDQQHSTPKRGEILQFIELRIHHCVCNSLLTDDVCTCSTKVLSFYLAQTSLMKFCTWEFMPVFYWTNGKEWEVGETAREFRQLSCFSVVQKSISWTILSLTVHSSTSERRKTSPSKIVPYLVNFSFLLSFF